MSSQQKGGSTTVKVEVCLPRTTYHKSAHLASEMWCLVGAHKRGSGVSKIHLTGQIWPTRARALSPSPQCSLWVSNWIHRQQAPVHVGPVWGMLHTGGLRVCSGPWTSPMKPDQFNTPALAGEKNGVVRATRSGRRAPSQVTDITLTCFL